MKIAITGLLCLALMAAACGGNAPTCNSVCSKVVECEPDTLMADCQTMCAQMQAVLRPAVFNTMGNCYLDTSCDALQANGDACYAQALAKADPTAGAQMISDVCDKMVECEAYAAKQDCIDYVNENEDGTFGMVGIFKASVIGCAVSCFDDADCADLESATQDCFDQCGLSFGESTDNQPGP